MKKTIRTIINITLLTPIILACIPFLALLLLVMWLYDEDPVPSTAMTAEKESKALEEEKKRFDFTPDGSGHPCMSPYQNRGWKVAIIIGLMCSCTLAQSSDPTGAKAQIVAGKQAKAQAVATIKSSPEWTGLTNQLAQYDGHYADYTNQIKIAGNKIALVADPATATALSKLLDVMDKQARMQDDVHDAVMKMKKIVVDTVNNQ